MKVKHRYINWSQIAKDLPFSYSALKQKLEENGKICNKLTVNDLDLIRELYFKMFEEIFEISGHEDIVKNAWELVKNRLI